LISKLVYEIAKPSVLVPGESFRREKRLGIVLGWVADSAIVPSALGRLLPVFCVPAVFQIESLIKKGKIKALS
jgi:hypothetical protein